MATVSVLMATFNGARFLRAQLESLAAQTLTPLELWVSDDGSTDDTLDIVRDFATGAPFPVRIRQNPVRLGYGENFLSGTRLCGGDYIAFCDQDDEWLPQKLQRCVESLERENAVLCVHSALLIDRQSVVIGRFDQGIEKTQLAPPLSLPPWDVYFGLTQVFARTLLDRPSFEQRGLDNHAVGSPLSHDRWVQFLAGSLGNTVLLAEPLVRYRQHGANAYGGLRKSALMRARGKLVGSSEILDDHAAIAAHRADLMFDVARNAPDTAIGDRAKNAAIFWQSLGQRYRDRAGLYRAPRFRDRLAILRRLRAGGVYAAAQGGRRLLAKDVMLGLFKAPVSALTPKDAHTATAVPLPTEITEAPR